MKTIFTNGCFNKKTVVTLLTGLLVFIIGSTANAQLGVYSFTGAAACPNQNPAINSQPANAVFSDYSTVNTNCQNASNVFETQAWNTTTTLDLTQYNSFTITPNAGFTLTLSSFTFTENVNQEPGSGTTDWYLRSSIDGYATDIATGTATSGSQTPTITLPAANFTNIGTVTFRLYLTNAASSGTKWTNDEVTIAGTVNAAPLPPDPANPTSNSPQCATPGVTMNFTGSAPAGETWYWQTSATGTTTTNSTSSYTVNTAGTYYVRSRDNTTLAWSSGAGSVAITISPVVGTPAFTLGATSTRCQGAGLVTYDASAANTSAITYSLSAAGGSVIDAGTGEVTWDAGFSGSATITASAAGCGGPKTTTHTVTVTATVGTPVFALGATSSRCQGAGSVTFSAVPSAGSSYVYSLDATTSGFLGNSFSPATGTVTYAAGWSGISVISVYAIGCNGPSATVTHTDTTKGTVGTPAFTLGATSTRCQGAGVVSYQASGTNAISITYSLSGGGGSTINALGDVTWVAGFSGSATITATATGCGGPKTATHTVSVTATVGTPAFNLGATSTRCQGAGTVTYTANATTYTSITYDLDTPSKTAGNSIDITNGTVTYIAGWADTSYITVTVNGCNGPKTAVHRAVSTLTVGTPSFTLGATSTRCQGAGTITYTATASNASGITYSIDALSDILNSINSSGVLTYSSLWFGTTTITATANGCNGPTTATHIVSITPNVSTPVFTAGSTSTRCQGAGTVTYDATNNNTAGITYSLTGGGGSTINPATGEVTWVAGFSGAATITASGAGCNGPKTATHNVTVTATVATPVFTLGASSTRCQGAGTVSYAANPTTGSTFVYSVDATTSSFLGNSFNPTTGALTYAAGWSGPSTISVYANGCNGPSATVTHTVTTTPTVTTPVFDSGATSIRCQGAGSVLYRATNNNNAGITYSLSAGGSILPATGLVTWTAGYSGTATITATAAGCNGPKTATHVVTVTATVGTPVFPIMGATSTRCQGAGTVTYAANATTNTGITYDLDTPSKTAGNAINPATGEVTWVAGWADTSFIIATATGCNGPKTAIHTAITTPTVGTPVFTLGATSTRCQGAGTVNYTATASTTTGLTYILDAITDAFPGNSINTFTGAVVFAAGWSGMSTVTVNAAGCNGPSTAVHTITTTPTVGTPVFSLGATSTRCQGAGTVTYTANATNTTGIIYTLDLPSRTAGNTIDAGTGDVTYVATWSGNSIITASAAGCNGPKTAIHTVTITPTVTTPVFVMGLQSVRTQGAATITYSANANYTTGITYTLDLASLTGGNSIDNTGKVIWNANWFGTSVITASAAGCNGPATAVHIVNINPSVVQAPLYLSTPGQILDRIDPVATNITTTVQTGVLSSTGTTNTTFSLNPALCSNLTIKAQTIGVQIYLTISSGSIPVNPNITALIKYGSTTIINLINPVYNSGNGILSWTGTLGADAIVPSGQPIDLVITTAQAGVTFRIDYHSMTKPSRISLFPVSTFIDFTSFDVYTAPYPGGVKRVSGLQNTTYYVRATVTTPFGYRDITGLDLKINPPGSTVAVTCIDSSACTRTYEYPWITSNTPAVYYLLATAKEGYENIIKNSDLLAFDVCSNCPPVALNDSAVGAGGAPFIVDVLLNDYDPNNNIKRSTLAITMQPSNGTGFVSNNKIVYLPNGTYAGKDTLTYQICDSTGNCGTAKVFFTVNPLLIDPCSEATKTHTYFIPYPEQDAWTALQASSSTALPSNTIRTVISLTMPYPGMTIVWDEWEDGYEINALNPLQATTKVWGDGNPYNGIAPGYASDIIPAGGSIILDNTMPANPRVLANVFYDGKDKITGSGQVAVTQVCGEPTNMPVQAIKTNVTSTFDFGQSFTIPLGQNYPSRDFQYTAMFIRAQEDGTVVDIDKDNNGSFETNFTLNQGQSYLVNGGVMYGATVTSNKPVGVELNAGGVDGFSIRNAPIYPATWYSNTYYSPVPTSDNSGDNPKDTSAVMLYNSLNRPIVINWNSGAPANGTITLPAKSVVRFPLAYSTTSAYKFYNPTGESFTAIEIVDSYTPGGGGNDGQTYDWAFNLIAEARLTDFATTAWAPGGLDLVLPKGPDVNGNPIWVTPNISAQVYVKWDGNVSGSTGLSSPCGLKYDTTFFLSALKYVKLRDSRDNDQSGLAVYTCAAGAKIAAVYGEDPQGSLTGIGIAYWDVGTTILPFCKQKLIFANDDYGRTMINQPVTIPILLNDFGFLAVVDPTSVTTTALLQPKHGSVIVNANGTVIYTPNTGYVGKDTFEYNVCSTPSPVVCDIATVYVDIAVCPAPFNENIIAGNVFLDKNDDGINNDNGTGVPGSKVYLYVDGNCNTVIDTDELKDSVIVDSTGSYQFITYPEKTVEDDFDGPGGTRTCANGSDGNAAWAFDWSDLGDAASSGFCTASTTANCEIMKDAGFTNGIRLKSNNVSATRRVNLSGAAYAFLSFSYRRKSATLAATEDVIVQASKDGITFGTVFTIAGDGLTDAAYVNIYNQDITQYASNPTYIRFLTNNNVDNGDTVYIDNVKVQFIRYPICYIVRMDSTTIPAYHHRTTILQRSVTATSAQTCLAPFDFGIAKNKISISGTLYHDANGLVDLMINGTAMGTIAGSTVYAYLVDSTGKVVQRTTLNSGTGAYSFAAADVYTNYTLRLSTISVNPGDPPPADAGTSYVAGNWTPTGDGYGSGNAAGSGNKAGTPTCVIPVTTGGANVFNVNFGIERLPDSDDKTISYTINAPGVKYDISTGLTGSDPEDGVLGAGKTYKITELPVGAVLYYNNIAVTLNQVIPSFTVALLKIDPDDQTHTTSFKYASMDAAGLYDPTPATVTVSWNQTLPVKLISFSGRLNGTKVDLNWVTANELNTKQFEVERSADGINFAKIATVAAKGNSSTATSYDLVDPLPLKGINYYRLKMVDIDGKFEYSRIVIIRIDAGMQLVTKVAPNPFTGKIDVYLTLTHNTMVDFRFIDINGRMVFNKSVKGLKGFNWFTINDLDRLPSAPYMLHIKTDDATIVEKLVKQ